MNLPDPIADDMSLYLPGEDRVSVIFGCAHAGAVNTLEHVLARTGSKTIDTLAGGLHLAAASEDRVDRTLAAVKANWTRDRVSIFIGLWPPPGWEHMPTTRGSQVL